MPAMRTKTSNVPVCFHLVILISLIFSKPNTAHASTSGKHKGLTYRIVDSYCKTSVDKKHYGKSTTKFTADSGKGNKFIDVNNVQLLEQTQRKVVLRTIFSELNEQYCKDNQILNAHAWNDLKLFFGSINNPQQHVLSAINRTTTMLGECALATLLVRPTADIDQLVARQNVIKFFLEEEDQLNQVKQLLSDYHDIEYRLLSFWVSLDPLHSQAYKTYMRKRFIYQDDAKNKRSKKLRSKIFLRNMLDIYGEFVCVPVIGAAWSVVNFLSSSIFSINRRTSNKYRASAGSALGFSDHIQNMQLFIPVYSIPYAIKNYLYTIHTTSCYVKPSVLPFLGVSITNGIALWRGFCGVKHYKEYSVVFSNLAKRLKDVQTFLKTIEQIDLVSREKETLAQYLLPCIQSIHDLLEHRKERDELGTLLRNLSTMPFDRWSYFCNRNSQLLETYYLFEEHKDCFKAAMYELGYLDSLISIATLMQESQKGEHAYVFTKFLSREEQNTPLVRFSAMWNPLLGSEKVIDNNLDMESKKVRNMVLCGPNAGGKSSFLVSSVISVLLSQTFGITPASQAVMTPFNKISSFIDRRDDFTKGESLFTVEVRKMGKHVHRLEQSKPHDFIFAIFDEPFSGTNPIEGGAVTYSTFAYMSKYPNALHIIASHYPIMTRLEGDIKGQGIKNFKICLKKIREKEMCSTYKVVPGTPDQTSVLNILKKKGYNQSLIQQALHAMDRSNGKTTLRDRKRSES